VGASRRSHGASAHRVVATALLVKQRDIWIVDLADPVGSEAGYRRPVVIVQTDSLNISRMTTYLVVPITGLEFRSSFAWNLNLLAKSTGLVKNSIAQTNLTLTVNESQLIERVGQVSEGQLAQLFIRLDIVLGRT
jgi:mRNA interferase MazF